VAVLERAIEALGENDREMALELEADLIGTARLTLETRHIALDHLARHSQIGESPSPAEQLLLTHMAAEAFATTGSAEHSVGLARRALSGDGLLENHGGGSPVFEYAVYALSLGDQLDEALQLSTRALELAVRRGSPTAFVRTLSVRSEINYRLGRVDDSLADARQGLDAMDEPWDVDRKMLMSALVHALIERGGQDEAMAELRAHGLDSGPVEAYFDNVLAHARGRLMLACGRVREGVDELLAVGARQEAWAAFNPAMSPWRSDAAPALASLGEPDEARRLAAEELDRARSTGARRAIGIALVGCALTSERDDQVELLEEAVTTLEQSPAALEHARALTQLGAALRRAGRRADARERLAAGLDIAHRCGATALAAQAHEELLAAGSRPRRLALTGRDALTPSERRVAEMAAQGLSNRDVAQALFVTVKTVEMHLGRTYRKLGIGSRGELAEALSTPRPDGSRPSGRSPSR
jgi:ATP/maltotriose-dependent transcriptional regulator MalT